ncbi:MAG: hypothetical protein EXX96DRAFT_576149 [Benjaminiella poitrasii]|nr:MAG: hypothetical protein EXX96DRAFT_576149 [Benjaminiella poitrasii]
MQDNKWTSPPDTPRNYMSLQSSYPYNSNNEYMQHSNTSSTVLPGMSTQPTMPSLLAGSQPSTPRPDMISPPPDKLATTPDLIRKRPPIPSRPASFTTTTFHSNPYPSSMSLRRRRTESSMFSFETGPSFSPTKQLLELWNIDQSNGYQIQINAKMDRGFFRADQDWTCYRRNYFQVSATFDVRGTNYMLQTPEVPCLVRTENGEIHQADFFSIGITARVSGNDKKIELVQHTPKRDKGPQMVPEPRIVSAGGNLHLASVGSNHNIVTFERMQFKTATANNGKRRAAQQYYEIVVDLYANTSIGKRFQVASCTSAPLVVRGRSPGHYADSHTRYRSMDAGTPSSIPAPFGAVGQNISATAGSGNSTANPPQSLPGVMASTGNGGGPEDFHYMQSPPLPRFGGGGGPLNPPTGSNPDFYAYQQSSASYPYPMGGYGSMLNTTPINPGRNNDDGPHREQSYLMHPYTAHPLSSSHTSANTNNPYNNGHHSQTLDANNSNNVYGNHPSNNNTPDNKPYWTAGSNNRDNPSEMVSHHNRYNSHNGHDSPYINSEFSGYGIRPQQNDNNTASSSSSNSAMESNPLDAGRSITSDNRHYLQHPSTNSHH